MNATIGRTAKTAEPVQELKLQDNEYPFSQHLISLMNLAEAYPHTLTQIHIKFMQTITQPRCQNINTEHTFRVDGKLFSAVGIII